MVEAGIGFDQLVSFTLEAALGDQRLTKADLAQLERAAGRSANSCSSVANGCSSTPTSCTAIMERVGHKGRSTVGELVRSSLGLGASHPSTQGDGEPARRRRRLGTGDRGGDRLVGSGSRRGSRRVGAATPHTGRLRGVLRPYQERGVGWLDVPRTLGPRRLPRRRHGPRQDRPAHRHVARRPRCPGRHWSSARCRCWATGHASSNASRPSSGAGPPRHRPPPGRPVALRRTRPRAVDVVLTTYSLVARDVDHLCRACVEPGRARRGPAGQEPRHRNSPGGAATRRRTAGSRLTGTPVENRLTELWSIMAVPQPRAARLHGVRSLVASPVRSNARRDESRPPRRSSD